MRQSLLVSAVLASGALLCSLAANAIPIKVGLLGASGGTTWTSNPIGGGTTTSSAIQPFAINPSHGTVSLSGWENDDGTWTPATMIQNPDVQGLGVECNSPLASDCTGDQIGSNPAQIIDLDISNLTDWTGLLITIDSVEGTNTGNLFGATCTPDHCQAISFLGGCTTVKGSCTLSLTNRGLTDITDIWITPIDLDPIVLDGNLFVCTGAGPCVKPTGVPEPTALGMFGLGLLLIGTFVGLRRRRLDE